MNIDKLKKGNERINAIKIAAFDFRKKEFINFDKITTKQWSKMGVYYDEN